MAQYLVLDIGGTFIKYAIMDTEAQFLEQGKVPAVTDSEEGTLGALASVRDAVSSFDYEGVAISMPGRIDTAAGIAHTGGAFQWVLNYPAAERYGAVFGKPCTIANDGKCAANGHAVAHHDGKTSRPMEHGTVLHVGVGTDGDGRHVAAQHGVVPHATLRTKLYVSDHNGTLRHVCGLVYSCHASSFHALHPTTTAGGCPLPLWVTNYCRSSHSMMVSSTSNLMSS